MGVPGPLLERRSTGHERTGTRSLEEILERAVTAGILERPQAEAIVSSERDGEVALPAEAGSRARALAAEALGYVGAVLALVSVILVAERFWTDLAPWGRAPLLALAAVTLVAAGAAVRPGATGPLSRLKSVLWFAATAAIAATVGVAAGDLTTLGPGAVALTVGTATGMAAVSLWRLWPATLQQLAFAASCVVTVMGGLDLLGVDLGRYAGLALWVLGVVWLILTHRRLVEPIATGYVLGGLIAIFGPFVATPDDEVPWLLVLGLLTAVAVIAASVPLRRTPLLAIGALGVFVHVPRLVFVYFGEALGPAVALFVAGAALIAVALGLARLRGAGDAGSATTSDAPGAPSGGTHDHP